MLNLPNCCPQCAKPVATGTKFCGNCGATLGSQPNASQSNKIATPYNPYATGQGQSVAPNYGPPVHTPSQSQSHQANQTAQATFQPPTRTTAKSAPATNPKPASKSRAVLTSGGWHCENCGSHVDSSASVCGKCGARLVPSFSGVLKVFLCIFCLFGVAFLINSASKNVRIPNITPPASHRSNQGVPQQAPNQPLQSEADTQNGQNVSPSGNRGFSSSDDSRESPLSRTPFQSQTPSPNVQQPPAPQQRDCHQEQYEVSEKEKEILSLQERVDKDRTEFEDPHPFGGKDAARMSLNYDLEQLHQAQYDLQRLQAALDSCRQGS